ncbi:sugar ABC transporter ATP-binding protein [Feifania hominis]|uniref:Sugar ABC transporter ATP-binding protein n=1 Tax=Feifania hominis TaxID=2763660 RepID=A0A926HU64_9FIRM|nr:sugar ABC transporter ATP-binding protein [Feifania hominis]MBC8535983.1 sugar ABC transporter ATP-binding protein [Feifania hominis]
MQQTILELREISKRFPGVQALNHAGLEIRKGEIHAVLGENGAGKSTLMKVILGMYQPDEGEIRWRGERTSFKNPHAALSRGICMIHQEISLVPSTTVAENIWIGREKDFTDFGVLNRRRMVKKARELLDRLEIHIDPRMRVQNLSVANMQLVEIARAISYEADLIIMDEPTSALTESEIQLLFKIMRTLTGQGVAIIFISHKLDEVLAVADRITVMRDGQYITTVEASSTTENDLIRWIAGRELKDLYPKEEAEIGPTVLEVRHLSRRGVFDDVSFEVHQGEILGFSGLMGAGRTEIMRALFGIDRCDSGEVLLHGKELRIRSPKQAIESGIGMLTEDRLRMGILRTLPVRANISMAYLDKLTNAVGFVNHRREARDCEQMVQRLNIKLASLKQIITSLSGGNQQKAIIGRWLLVDPKVLILDEPTRGIDVGSKSEIHRQISLLAQQGMAIIMISSELPEVMGMSDRILVVRGGKIVGEHLRGQFDQETIMKEAFGQTAREAVS